MFAHKNNSVEGLANYVTNKPLQQSNLIILNNLIILRHADDNYDDPHYLIELIFDNMIQIIRKKIHVQLIIIKGLWLIMTKS